jgi:hypothetical protein
LPCGHHSSAAMPSTPAGHPGRSARAVLQHRPCSDDGDIRGRRRPQRAACRKTLVGLWRHCCTGALSLQRLDHLRRPICRLAGRPCARGSGSDLKRGALLSPAGGTQIHCHGIIAAWHAELDFIARQPDLVASIENRGPQNAQLVVLDAPRSCRWMPQVIDDQPTTAFEYLAPMAVVGDTFPYKLSTNFGCGEGGGIDLPRRHWRSEPPRRTA